MTGQQKEKREWSQVVAQQIPTREKCHRQCTATGCIGGSLVIHSKIQELKALCVKADPGLKVRFIRLPPASCYY